MKTFKNVSLKISCCLEKRVVLLFEKSVFYLCIRVPPGMRMVMDFLACVLFKTSSHSSRVTVNRIAAVFHEAAKAEGTLMI